MTTLLISSLQIKPHHIKYSSLASTPPRVTLSLKDNGTPTLTPPLATTDTLSRQNFQILIHSYLLFFFSQNKNIQYGYWHCTFTQSFLILWKTFSHHNTTHYLIYKYRVFNKYCYSDLLFHLSSVWRFSDIIIRNV